MGQLQTEAGDKPVDHPLQQDVVDSHDYGNVLLQKRRVKKIHQFV